MSGKDKKSRYECENLNNNCYLYYFFFRVIIFFKNDWKKLILDYYLLYLLKIWIVNKWLENIVKVVKMEWIEYVNKSGYDFFNFCFWSYNIIMISFVKDFLGWYFFFCELNFEVYYSLKMFKEIFLKNFDKIESNCLFCCGDCLV